MNPCAQATIMRAAGSARSAPTSSAIIRKKVAEERTDRPVAPAAAVASEPGYTMTQEYVPHAVAGFN